MPRALIHQIYYSPETRASLDPGFIPLDNLANERPDWREYWPIRHFLLNNTLDEDVMYGFFSPKFKEKTGLAAETVHDFVARHPPQTDVVLFSPFFDQSAFYQNVFEQGMTHDRRFFDLCKAAVDLFLPGVALEALVMDSRTTVFCNYFVAKPRFWRDWLHCCELVFRAGEERAGELGAMLNADIPYDKTLAPAKVFIIERVASLLLTAKPGWQVGVYDPLQFRIDSLFVPYRNELVCLDALKIAFQARGGQQVYWDLYTTMRRNIAAASRADYERRKAADAGAQGATGLP